MSNSLEGYGKHPKQIKAWKTWMTKTDDLVFVIYLEGTLNTDSVTNFVMIVIHWVMSPSQDTMCTKQSRTAGTEDNAWRTIMLLSSNDTRLMFPRTSAVAIPLMFYEASIIMTTRKWQILTSLPGACMVSRRERALKKWFLASWKSVAGDTGCWRENRCKSQIQANFYDEWFIIITCDFRSTSWQKYFQTLFSSQWCQMYPILLMQIL